MSLKHKDILADVLELQKNGKCSRFICDNILHSEEIYETLSDAEYAVAKEITNWIRHAINDEFCYESWLFTKGIRMDASEMRKARIAFVEWMLNNHWHFSIPNPWSDLDYREYVTKMLLRCAGH